MLVNDYKLDLVRKELNVLETMLSLVSEIKEVSKRFNNKKINKRYETALRNEVNENLRVSLENSLFTISYDIPVNDRRVDLQNHSVYLDATKKDFFICSFHNDTKSYNVSKGIMQDEYFQYDILEKKLNDFVESTNRTYLKVMNNICELDNLRKEREELKKQIETFNDKVTYIIDKQFKLKIY